MVAETTESNIIHLHRYRAKPVRPFLHGLLMGEMFAYVLNVPSSEELWPGDAAALFFREYFAMRFHGEDEVFVHRNQVWEHMREEILRLCDPEGTLESRWRHDHILDCHFFNGSFAKELYGDGSDDENEDGDTLNSELLLTEEYYTPDASKAKIPRTTFGLKCPVGAIPPTEQED